MEQIHFNERDEKEEVGREKMYKIELKDNYDWNQGGLREIVS